MAINKARFVLTLFFATFFQPYFCAEDFNNLEPDGSFAFGYNNPDSYHHGQGNRNNVVRGDFGSRNPGTGAIDSIQYTAGPRGFRPRGKNVVRKYDFNQVRTGPIGSRDDPYFDPNEDPSYNFAFNTRTYNRQEAANRVGDVTGKYSYLDDVGERHNVEFIAGKNTGFHVRSAVPDNKPLSFSPLQYVGKRRPPPRGRTTVQRGLDGSYRFVSGGPDHRRTETSDATGHVRGSYTYLDDKGVRHSVHYIAGPETGYRVLKNVKGPHLPTIFPFGRPEIIPPDFYDYPTTEDVFDTAASGHVKPSSQGGLNPSKNQGGDSSSNFGSGSNNDNIFDNFEKPDKDFDRGSTSRPGFGSDGKRPQRPTFEDDGSDVGDIFGTPLSGTTGKPAYPDDGSYKPSEEDGSYRPGINESGGGGTLGTLKPGGIFGAGSDFGSSERPTGGKPTESGSSFSGRPTGSDSPFSGRPTGSDSLFGGRPSGPGSTLSGRPSDTDSLFGGRPTSSGDAFGGKPTSSGDAFGGRPTGSGNVFGGRPADSGTSVGGSDVSIGQRPSGRPTPSSGSGRPNRPNYDNDGSNEVNNNFDLFGGTGGSGGGGAGGGGVGDGSHIGIGGSSYNDAGTIVTNVGDKLFSVPPGVSVRAHVQAIDLLPLRERSLSPGDQLKAEATELKAQNSDTSIQVDKSVNKSKTLPKNSTERVGGHL